MRAIALVALVGAFLVLGATAHSWLLRENLSRRTRRCEGTRDDSRSWVNHQAYTRCTTCQQRCYKTTFTATAETSGYPFGLCSTSGQACDITVYVKTAPCCRCTGGHQEQGSFVEEPEETFEMLATESLCEVEQMIVTVNGFWTLPLDPACNTTGEPFFTQCWLEDDYTENSISDCYGGGSSGALLHQVYNEEYRNGRYPDPCFSDKHWKSSFVSEEKDLIASTFTMYRPGYNDVWFDHTLEQTEGLSHIGCGDFPKTTPPPYVEPLL